VREIAVLLDTSVSAIKSRLYQARQQLKGLLAAFCEPTPLTKPATEREPIMISVTIADIVINVKSEKRMIVLADEERRRALPIWIGPFEADAILLTLKNVSTARPMSYDFFATMPQAAGITLEAVRGGGAEGEHLLRRSRAANARSSSRDASGRENSPIHHSGGSSHESGCDSNRSTRWYGRQEAVNGGEAGTRFCPAIVVLCGVESSRCGNCHR
jgi:hypothetical protein